MFSRQAARFELLDSRSLRGRYNNFAMLYRCRFTDDFSSSVTTSSLSDANDADCRIDAVAVPQQTRVRHVGQETDIRPSIRQIQRGIVAQRAMHLGERSRGSCAGSNGASVYGRATILSEVRGRRDNGIAELSRMVRTVRGGREAAVSPTTEGDRSADVARKDGFSSVREKIGVSRFGESRVGTVVDRNSRQMKYFLQPIIPVVPTCWLCFHITLLFRFYSTIGFLMNHV